MPRILICFLENNDGKITRTQPKKTTFFCPSARFWVAQNSRGKTTSGRNKKRGRGCGGARRKPASHSSISLPPPSGQDQCEKLDGAHCQDRSAESKLAAQVVRSSRCLQEKQKNPIHRRAPSLASPIFVQVVHVRAHT